MSGAPVKMETDVVSVEAQIIELVTSFPQGVGDKVLIANMPYVDPKARAQAINKLLVEEKIDLFKSSDGLLYRLKSPSKAATISGDQEEKIVFRIVENAGNLGSWIRDIRAKSNLGQTQLTKVLKSLEAKRLIKAVKSVNATKKKVRILILVPHLSPSPNRCTCCITLSLTIVSLGGPGTQTRTLSQNLLRFLTSKHTGFFITSWRRVKLVVLGPLLPRTAQWCPPVMWPSSSLTLASAR